MNKYFKLPFKFWKNLYDKYKNGSTLLELAKIYGICGETIKRYFLNLNFVLRTKEEVNKLRQSNIEQTNLKRYGTKYSFQLKNVKEKIKQTNLKNLGVENPSQNEKIKEKKKQTCLKHYGTKNPFQNKQIREKAKQTNLKRYGTEYASQNKEVNEKIKQTNLKRYGKQYGFQSEQIKEKIKQTNLKNLGVENPSQNEQIKKKKKQTYLKHYNVENPFQSKKIKEKIKQTNLERYGTEYSQQNEQVKKRMKRAKFKKFLNKFSILYPDYELLDEYKGHLDKNNKWIKYNFKCLKCEKIFSDYFHHSHPRCLSCNPIITGKSNLEQIYYDFIKNELKIDNVQRNIRILYDPETKRKKEIDIYLPDYKIGFEINGLYYHNSDPKSDSYKDKYYHILKQNLALEQGIKLFHIWDKKNINIYKSIIRNLLEKTKNKIHARKCQIKQVNREDAEIFLEQNHINGYINSSLHFGLYYKDELISIICFRKNEISRFCSKLNTVVVGGFSKLLKYSLKQLDYESIFTYCDKEFCIQPEDSVYYKNGFKFIKETEPKLYYTDFKQIYSRQKFMKHKLKDMKGYDPNLTADEILSLNDIYPLYSVGNYKFTYII